MENVYNRSREDNKENETKEVCSLDVLPFNLRDV